MSFELTLITLLHLLIFAYWLGGDIGVFYSSLFLTDPKRKASERLMAGKILADVDLVPRFCLLMTLPSGLLLADAKGWLAIPSGLIIVAFVIAIGWCWLVWHLHMTHGKSAPLKSLDLGMRLLLMFGLFLTAGLSFTSMISLPIFLALKMALLGFTIAMGLTVRLVMRPFAPAFGQLMAAAQSGSDIDPQTNQTIQSCLNKARPAVVMIWISLATAAALGVAMPIGG